MPDFTPHELERWSAGSWTALPSRPVTGVTQDTRVLRPGDLYVAVRGQHADGHSFVAQALRQGASGAVVDRVWTPPAEFSGALLQVADTPRALRAMAAGYRARLGTLTIGVTGSVGKTTVKDMIAAILSAVMPTARTRGNWNNDIGLPLSLLAMEPEHQAGVFELGMNHPGEMGDLCSILAPNWGVVTTVGPVHLEFFASVAAIAEEKSVLLQRLPPDGVAFLSRDGDYFDVLRRRAACRIVSVSAGADADYRLVGERASAGEGTVLESGSGATLPIRLPVPGRHNLANALLAIAVARTLGVPWARIGAALEGYTSAPMRWERSDVAGVRVINDAYNANPVSMRAALETFRDQSVEGRKWLVLGAMRELGAAEAGEHDALGAWLARLPWAGVFTVGPLGDVVAAGIEAAGTGIAVVRCAAPGDAGRALAAVARSGDAVLFKASRGVRLEEAVREFSRIVRKGAESI